MKIKLYWPECNLNYFNGVDAFWVECTIQEAESKVFPLLNQDQIEESKKNWEPIKSDSRDKLFETDNLCFLVSKDLCKIVPFPWYYPYSGQWNAYCPFKIVDEVEIEQLKGIQTHFPINKN